MTTVFTEVPFTGYGYRDELLVAILRDGGPYEERRVPLADISRRRYSFPMSRNNTERQTVDAFLVRARQLQCEAFYVQDPRDDGLTDVSIGTGTGAAVTFSLPTTGENRRFFPIDNGNLVVEVSGSPVTVSSVNTDARTVTLAAPPGGSAPVTISCDVYRLCRLEDFSWTVEHANWASTTVEMVEVVSASG